MSDLWITGRIAGRGTAQRERDPAAFPSPLARSGHGRRLTLAGAEQMELIIRMDSEGILPEQVPVMPLPGAVLFPHALLPLYIFEARYQEMLKHALARHRMFAIATLKPPHAQWSS